jgi:hypothetical protein
VTITITPAALHAALAELRKLGAEREDNNDAAAFFIDGLNVLEALLNPAHQQHPTLPETAGAAAAQEPGISPTATAAAASRPDPANAGTPAPPTIELPAGTGEAAYAASDTPAGTGAPPAPEAPPPAQAAEGRRDRRLRATPEDDALLRELWPQAMPFREMMRQFNKRASSPVKSDVRLRERAIRLGMPTQRHLAMVAAGNAPASRGMVKGVWTKERDELLTARYPREGVRLEVLEALNALPGPPIESPNAVKARAHRLNLRLDEQGLQRIGAELAAKARAGRAAKRAERRAAIATMRAEREPSAEPDPPEAPAAADPAEAPPAPAPPPPPPLPPPADPADPTPEESAAIADQALLSKHDRCRQKLRVLLKEKPKDTTMACAGIAAGMGMPLREVMRLLGEVRAEGAA